MNKLKKYLKNHPGTTIEDYNNQRHSMIVMQATRHCTTKHVGQESKTTFSTSTLIMNTICKDCALRLYNTKSYNLQGVGNPFYGNCIVVPNVDYKAYKGKSMDFSTQVEIIKETLSLSTGVEESNFYIVPLIRCNEQISCKLDKITFNKCLHWLADDMRKYNLKNILLLGSAANRLLKVNIRDYLDTIILSRNGKRYFVNYAPRVKYVDEKLFEDFKTYLIKWYNSINSEMFDYNLKML